MIARRNPSPMAADGDPPSGLHLDAFRALVSEPGAWKALLHEEHALGDFVERCRTIVDYTDRLALDLKEQQLVNLSILEHGTSIENDLDAYKEKMVEQLEIAKAVQQKLLPERDGPL